MTHSSCSVTLFPIEGKETSIMYALVLRPRSLNCKYLILTDIFCVKQLFINKEESIYITCSWSLLTSSVDAQVCVCVSEGARKYVGLCIVFGGCILFMSLRDLFPTWFWHTGRKLRSWVRAQ